MTPGRGSASDPLTPSAGAHHPSSRATCRAAAASARHYLLQPAQARRPREIAWVANNTPFERCSATRMRSMIRAGSTGSGTPTFDTRWWRCGITVTGARDLAYLNSRAHHGRVGCDRPPRLLQPRLLNGNTRPKKKPKKHENLTAIIGYEGRNASFFLALPWSARVEGTQPSVFWSAPDLGRCQLDQGRSPRGGRSFIMSERLPALVDTPFSPTGRQPRGQAAC